MLPVSLSRKVLRQERGRVRIEVGGNQVIDRQVSHVGEPARDRNGRLIVVDLDAELLAVGPAQ